MIWIICISSLTRAAICPLGDLNGDCTVDLLDVRLLADHWLDPGCSRPDCPADLIEPAGVGLADFAVLAGNFQRTGVPVVISEFMADNEGSVTTRVNGHLVHPDWLELYNPSEATVDLGGCYLTDNSADRTKWPIPAGTILPGGGYLVIFASSKLQEDYPDNFPFVDDLGYLHTNFSLNNEGEYLALVRPDGQNVEFEYPRDYPDTEEYPTQYDDWSYGLSADLLGEGYFYPATPGRANTDEPVGDPTKNIVINEIMYHPAHAESASQPEPLGREFIELYNRGIQPVSLAGWRIADGVDFSFAARTMNPGDYLVVAANRSAFLSFYPQVDPDLVVGNWQGHLSNSGETVEIVDQNGLRMDRVHYADQGDWSVRRLGPLDDHHRGWQWSDDHDGAGRSLELIQPLISNDYGQNWTASQLDGGTPGSANSVAAATFAPLILEVSHRPILARSGQPVVVTARIRNVVAADRTVRLHYRLDESTYQQDTYPTYDPDSYTVIAMTDDGTNGDRRPLDGVYSATIPAALHAAGAIVEFFVETGQNGVTRTWPAPVDVDGSMRQVVNCLYQVHLPDPLFDPDGDWAPGSQPIYFIIMTRAERDRLADIHNGSGGPGSEDDSDSDAQMNATFISVDGVDTKLRYATGVRNRGNGSRDLTPNNFRVNFRNDEPWKDVTAINLNGRYTYIQYIGHTLFRLAGLAAEDPIPVQLRINGVNRAADYLSLTQG
ncbi:MAG: lamin tail domain-containing protein, partial [Sedimentisphaerales bacterium]|nr:lamin tail domain-containing protein [Sedimentisphaerales bacterium]